jgi:hypothetical protein
VGPGVMTEQGSGNGQFNGSIFLAKTNSSTSPYSQLSVLGIPSSSGMAAALNGIQYNSCWANIGNDLHYLVVASREDSFPIEGRSATSGQIATVGLGGAELGFSGHDDASP